MRGKAFWTLLLVVFLFAVFALSHTGCQPVVSQPETSPQPEASPMVSPEVSPEASPEASPGASPTGMIVLIL